MGNVLNTIYFDTQKPEWLPDKNGKITFPPDLGFESARQVRESKMSLQEMQAMRIRPQYRDYCAYLLRDYYLCRRKNAPFYALCKHELHKHKECELEDFTLRLKEYEREKRLRIRELKLQGQEVH